MGRYKSEGGMIVRELGHLTIIVRNSETIDVYPKGWRYGTTYHRWYAPLGSYRDSWKPFRRALLHQRRPALTMEECRRLAQKYGVCATYTLQKVKLTGKEKYL